MPGNYEIQKQIKWEARKEERKKMIYDELFGPESKQQKCEPELVYPHNTLVIAINGSKQLARTLNKVWKYPIDSWELAAEYKKNSNQDMEVMLIPQNLIARVRRKDFVLADPCNIVKVRKENEDEKEQSTEENESPES